MKAGGGRVLADPKNPAGIGDQVLIEATGLGAVDPGFNGATVPVNPLPQVRAPVSVTIGGVSAQVTSATLSPEVPGLYFVQAIVPAGVSPTGAAPVIVTSAGQSSPVVYMAVR